MCIDKAVLYMKLETWSRGRQEISCELSIEANLTSEALSGRVFVRLHQTVRIHTEQIAVGKS